MARRILAVALVALTMTAISPIPSASACDTIADYSTWDDNCLTDWAHYRISDLTTGVQVILKYDDHQGWVSSTDGVYGLVDGSGSTPAAVKVYQEDRGLDDDGKTGSLTWGMLDGSFQYDFDSGTYWYYDIDNTTWRMRIKKSTSQAEVKRADGVWVRVDAWRN